LCKGKEACVLDLNEQLKETAERLRPVMGRDVEIAVVTNSDQALVNADPGQMDQMIENLASNAREAMPCGGRFMLETSLVELGENSTHVRRGMKAGKYVLLAISDSGTGMDFNAQSRCFEPFFTTKECRKGIGLSTVYTIVRCHYGDITVSSDLGRGTTFMIYLPSIEDKIDSSSIA
jgi:signal transduction histidine kinase